MALEHSSGADPRTFKEVEAWIFDLDNTLYPPSSRLFELIDQRMALFIADRFGIDGLSARALQKHYYRKHGTTLRGLMTVDGVDPHAFMDFVHEIDHGRIAANPSLALAIGRLPGKRFILTNGSVKHATNVAKAIGIFDLFDGVFDIAAADFVPKPESVVYERFLAHFGVAPERAAMFEDLAHNLIVPHRMGMTTVLVTPQGEDVSERMRHVEDAVKGPHVDHVTDDLTAFLEAVLLDR
jgi:putative hydrolase of the HAD superfamily